MEYYTLEVVAIINAVVAGLLQNSARKFRYEIRETASAGRARGARAGAARDRQR